MMSTQKGGEYHVNESVCFMDPDIFVFWQQSCGENDPVSFRNHCLLLGDKDSGRVWIDVITGDAGDFCFQQGGGAFCYCVSSPLSIKRKIQGCCYHRENGTDMLITPHSEQMHLLRDT